MACYECIQTASDAWGNHIRTKCTKIAVKKEAVTDPQQCMGGHNAQGMTIERIGVDSKCNYKHGNSSCFICPLSIVTNLFWWGSAPYCEFHAIKDLQCDEHTPIFFSRKRDRPLRPTHFINAVKSLLYIDRRCTWMVQYGQSTHEKQLCLLYRRKRVNIEYGAFSNNQ
jgi:hypothetical protein